MKIFEPVKIRNMQLKNRIIMPAMHLGYCKDGFVSDRIINFYRERAEGGAGLLIIGGCRIDEHGYLDMISLSTDAFIPGHKRLTSAVQQAGGKICAQLLQPGKYISSAVTGIQAIAPSPIVSPITREVPRDLTVDEVYEIISLFGNAAARAKEAGYDAVEIIGSAGYLICQFLSPLTNQRTDEFGGSFSNRMKFGIEVVKEVRQRVGDYPILFRISGNEFVPGGSTIDEIKVFVQELEKAGVDIFNVTGGWHETRVPQITMDVPNGAYIYLAQKIKQVVNVPVIACNRINDPWLAEEILLQGRADMVGMARALLADHELPKKAQEGRSNEIRRCIACNQGCLDAIFANQSVKCLVNARAGRETEAEIIPARKVKKVLVIGGGAAGMEAARVAALRGHKVTLWEKDGALGGQVSLAAAVPDREEFFHLVDDLKEILITLGVDVVLHKEATIDELKDFQPDVVIVATGARPVRPSIPGIDNSNVLSAWDVLAAETEVGKKVVIIGGGAVGCETAIYLAHIGTIDSDVVRFLLINKAESPEKIRELATRGTKEVLVLEKEKAIGADIGISTKWIILQKLKSYGVKVKTLVEAKNIEKDGVLIVNREGKEEKISCDSVVTAVGSAAENRLYYEIKDLFPEVYLVGDAQNPRKVLNAIHEGFNVGNTI